uniref:Uncharacterized protein n=1 Tax=Oryza rufipogon TaxID=4529 RepID=A0A0E0PIB6_ORYRU
MKLPSSQCMRSFGWVHDQFFSHTGPTTKITFPIHLFLPCRRSSNLLTAPLQILLPAAQIDRSGAASSPPPDENRLIRRCFLSSSRRYAGGTEPTRSRGGRDQDG